MGNVLGDVNKWFSDDGDYTHRLNYNLNKDSIVFDLGGYTGWFTEQINTKYMPKIYCFEPLKKYALIIQTKFSSYNNVFVFPLAISDKNGKDIIYINNDSSSMFDKRGDPCEIETITLDKVMIDNNITHIDLIKINIEGEEYPLLEYMIKNSLIEKCDNIQVQFHTFIENYEVRYNDILHELEKTHHLTYHYPFVWENWKK